MINLPSRKYIYNTILSCICCAFLLPYSAYGQDDLSSNTKSIRDTAKYTTTGLKGAAEVALSWQIGEYTDPQLLAEGARAHLSSSMHDMSKISKGAGHIATALKVIDMGVIAYDVYEAYKAYGVDRNERVFAEKFNVKVKEAVKTAASWAGAAAGAKLGAAGGAAATVWFFGAGALIGGAVGGIAGGIGVGMLASHAAGEVYDEVLSEFVTNSLAPEFLALFEGKTKKSNEKYSQDADDLEDKIGNTITNSTSEFVEEVSNIPNKINSFASTNNTEKRDSSWYRKKRMRNKRSGTPTATDHARVGTVARDRQQRDFLLYGPQKNPLIGIKELNKDLKELQNAGFDIKSALGGKMVGNYNDLMAMIKSLAIDGFDMAEMAASGNASGYNSRISGFQQKVNVIADRLGGMGADQSQLQLIRDSAGRIPTLDTNRNWQGNPEMVGQVQQMRSQVMTYFD